MSASLTCDPPSSVPAKPPANASNEPRQGNTTALLAPGGHSIKSSCIMIIDDEPLVIRVVRRFLQAEGYHKFVQITDPREAMKALQEVKPDLVLLDVMMPHITGLDILRERAKLSCLQYTPFIILSAVSEAQVKREALRLGATEFLNKPVDSSDLSLRVRNALIVKAHQDSLANLAESLEVQVRQRTAQLERSREQIIRCLAKAAEYRDNETGRHVIRVGKYAAVVADQLGFDSNYCCQIELAAQLHDVGKIGVPDSILLNPNKLTPDQFELMQRHSMIGAQIIDPLQHGLLENSETDALLKHTEMGGDIMSLPDAPLLQMASSIARTHHEKWDGTGYPNRLRGEEIPIEGRITSVADVYDALSTVRPYKPAFSVEKCLSIMMEERGTRFDPRVLDAFLQRFNDVYRIQCQYADDI